MHKSGYFHIMAVQILEYFLVSLIGKREFPQIQTRYLTSTYTNMYEMFIWVGLIVIGARKPKILRTCSD